MKFEFEAKTIGDISDGSHTFNELYHHRMMLFTVICNTYKNSAWKSFKHHDGTMYDDYFIVGIETPKGQYSYHYHKDNWNMFDVKVLENAPEWDGHEPKDIDRLLSLISKTNNSDYKERFKTEYYQLKNRVAGLQNMLAAWDNNNLTFEPTCPRSTYNLQLRAMQDYKAILEMRAVMENIEIDMTLEAAL